MNYIKINDHKYVLGSNQHRKTPKTRRNHNKHFKITPGGMIGASMVITIMLFAIAHYSLLWTGLIHKAGEELPRIHKAYAAPVASSSATLVASPSATFSDTRIKKVYDYLVSKNSPLADYAELIVKEADKNDISWTLVVAISGKESSFGTVIKPDSHNAWGVMAWDRLGNRFIRSFPSWEEGIKFESTMLSKNFRKDSNAGIQTRYCPSYECSTTWTENVTSFQEEINQ